MPFTGFTAAGRSRAHSGNSLNTRSSSNLHDNATHKRLLATSRPAKISTIE